MRVFTSVIEVATLAMLHPGQELPLGRAVALQLIGGDDAWHVQQPLEQLAKKLLGRPLVPAALHQDIQHVIVLIHRAPQIIALAIDRQEDLVQVPLVHWLGASVLQLIGVLLPKLATSLTDGLMGYHDAALEQYLLHVAVAQREAIIEPDSMADDLAGEAMVLVAFGVSVRSHIGFLS